MIYDLLSVFGTWTIFALWQSTIFLLVSLFCARFFSTKAAWKSYVFYLVGISGALIAPSVSTLVAYMNFGLLRPGLISDYNLYASGQMIQLGGLFSVGVILFLAMILLNIFASRKLMFDAKPLADRESQDVLLLHAKHLRSISLPVLFTSEKVKSPTVWCWGLHPAIVLPEQLVDKLTPLERDAVFLHELAHIIRRDHFTLLFAQLASVLLFWNPVYWLVISQCRFYADIACDSIVVSHGFVSVQEYTDTLLKLA
ncbi:MAG: M56 family metallopeptidase, partial [Thermoguttaceae bacterium]